GFVDAHVHLLRSARDADAVDCRPPRVTSVADLLGAIAERARTAAPSAWVDAAGYHELDLAERRHPTSAELHAAGDGHPVRLRHRSGHGAVVSPLGLQKLGIDASTADPPGGRIERDADGRPTGMLTGRAVSLLRRSHATLADDVAALCDDWLAMGITTVCDAGPDNDESRMHTFVDLARSGSLRLRLVLMRGAADALVKGEVASPWRIPDDVRHRIRAGPVKFLLTHTGGSVHPAAADLVDSVAALSRAGQPCAIHAASLETIAAAISAVEEARGDGVRHRIEHASLLPDALLERLQHSGAAVVTHPLFVANHGDRYLLDESEHPTAWLYRCGALLDAGIDVAVGSDAPVVAPSPLRSIAAAMTRRTLSGRVIAPEECISFDEALPMHTANAARICGAGDLGVLRPGAAADFVILPRDPARLPADELGALPVTATYLGAILVAGSAAPATEFLPC
ncbi:MAG TPA: amidohydrolase family protein, partial [Candidatus Dormibacteraeota bacterium]|nr:amidohydrolase family protein [Candidatus Dormibacteraeota bacterium]